MIDRQYIGQKLLELGFRKWFLYLFKAIEDRPFIVEPIHSDLFDVCQEIVEQKRIRQIINLPPRSAKTTLMKYLVVYAITINPKSNIIYTSFSQSLLGEISSGIASILESPIYKALYPQKIEVEDEQLDGIDEFWKNYKIEETKGKQNYYSAKKITTYAGGVCLFASVGAQITGYGCGIRNCKGFSGALIIDDPNKPADVTSEVMRSKVLRYYEETLLSRLNNSNVPIIEVQQRLHVEDLTGQLEKKYKFDILRKALIVDGVCQIPSQYTKERIEEIQINDYMFQAQYQQEPILNGGNIIKIDWFKYYQTGIDYKYKRILITADTAMKIATHNDYSVFIVGGVTPENKLHIIDMVRGKWEAPDLKKVALDLYNQYKIQKKTGVICSGLYVEDKASGTGLIQEFKKIGIPIRPLKCDTDKLSRVESVLTYIANGNVMLPNNAQYGFNPDLLKECAEFSRDDSHAHDDICFVAGTEIATVNGKEKIENVKIGDKLITPLGTATVLATGQRQAEVITNIGLTGTYNHKVFSLHNDIFDDLINMKYNDCSRLDLKGLLQWEKMKLLSLMENGIIFTERKDIINHGMINAIENRGQDFTEMYGNFIQDKKYQKAIIFTIKMVIRSITTIQTLSVYLLKNIIKDIKSKLENFGKDLTCKKQTKKVEKNAKNGTQAKQVNNGIVNIKNNILQNCKLKKYAKNVDKNSEHLKTTDIKYIAESAEINFLKENCEEKQKKTVYSIKTDKGIYYANNILVSNCDALTYCIQEALAKNNVSLLDYFME